MLIFYNNTADIQQNHPNYFLSYYNNHIFLLMCGPLCQWICDCFKNKNNRKVDKHKKKRLKKSKKHKKSNKMDKSRSDSNRQMTAHNQHSISPMDSYYQSHNQSEYKSTEESPDSKSTVKRQPSPTFTQLSLTKDLTKEYKVSPNGEFKTAADVLRHYNYKLGVEIGRGGYGTVYKAYKIDPKSPQTEIMACKLIDLNKTKKLKLKGELYVLEKLKHEHVIELYDHFIINDYAYIFMEFADGNNMSDEIKRGPLSNNTARRYFAHMISAINYMHKKMISHRDLKLDNILLMKSKNNSELKDVKISDFGMSQLSYKESKSVIKSGRYAGTRYYMAPEIIRIEVFREHSRDPALKFSPYKADMWALGVCLFEMLTTYHPFSIRNNKQMLYDQENGNWSYPSFIRSKIDPNADNLIKLLLEPNSSKRIDSPFVMFHEWLKPEFNV